MIKKYVRPERIKDCMMLKYMIYDESRCNFNEVKTSIEKLYDYFQDDSHNTAAITFDLIVRNTFNPESKDEFVYDKIIVSVIVSRHEYDHYVTSRSIFSSKHHASIIKIEDHAMHSKLDFTCVFAHELGHIIYRFRMDNTKYVKYPYFPTDKALNDFKYEFEEACADAFAIAVLGSVNKFVISNIALKNYVKKHHTKDCSKMFELINNRNAKFKSFVNLDEIKEEYYFTRKKRSHSIFVD